MLIFLLGANAHRAVAQFGSALDWGSRGRGFKSRRPDEIATDPRPSGLGFFNVPNRAHLGSLRRTTLRRITASTSSGRYLTRFSSVNIQ